MRQQQRGDALRRHQFLGNECCVFGVKHGRRQRRNASRNQRKVESLLLFSSPTKMEDVYEDDCIEGERYIRADEDDGCKENSGRVPFEDEQTFTEAKAVEQPNNQHAVPSQALSSHLVTPSVPSPTREIGLPPRIAGNCDDEYSSRPPLKSASRKHQLSPISGLTQAFMDFSLGSHDEKSDCEGTTDDNTNDAERKMTIIISPSASTCVESRASLDESMESPANEVLNFDVTQMPSRQSLEPVIDSGYSSFSSSVTSMVGEVNSTVCSSVEVLVPLPQYSQQVSELSTPTKSDETTICDDLPMLQQAKQVKFTPLTQTILFGSPSKNARHTVNAKTTQSAVETPTPKRKPKGSKLSSSKRRRKDTTKSGAAIKQSNEGRGGTQLYNGKAVERIQNVRRCKDKFCTLQPSIHSRKAACERCWTLASESERKTFVDNGGRHLRINVVKSGCPPSCKLFSHRATDAAEMEEEAVRLCRRCFDDLHHVGMR